MHRPLALRQLLALLLLLLPVLMSQDYNVAFRRQAAAPAVVWTSVGSLMTAANGSAATTWAPTTSATLEAGNVGVCMVSKDNEAATSTDGSGNAEFTSAIDAAGNTWIEAAEYCEAQTGVDTGTCGALYYVKAATQLNSGAAITFTFGFSTGQKAATCWEFNIPAGYTVAEAAGKTSFSQTATGTLTSTSVNTTVDREHLWIRGAAVEHGTATWTGTASPWTSFTHTSSQSGTTATGQAARAEWDIATGTTNPSPSAPTVTASDNVSIMLALDADAPTGVDIAVGVSDAAQIGFDDVVATAGIATQASGSVFLVGVGFNLPETITSMADNKGNTYSQIGTTQEYLANTYVNFYRCNQPCAGGSGHTFTVTVSNNGSICIAAVEIKNVNASAYDQDGVVVDSASPYTSTSETTTTADQALVSVIVAGDAVTGWAESNGFTIQASETSAAARACAIGTRIVTSTGTYDASWTATSATRAVVGIQTVKD